MFLSLANLGISSVFVFINDDELILLSVYLLFIFHVSMRPTKLTLNYRSSYFS